MTTYEENLKRLVLSKDPELALLVMSESKRRGNLEDWLFAYFLTKVPVSFNSIMESAQECLEKSGASVLELAEAYRDVLEKYSDMIVFMDSDLSIIRPLGPLPKEVLKEFVRGFCDGRIFTSEQVKSADDLAIVFMPIVFGALQDVELESVGVIYEDLSQAGPRSINGYPIFFSMRMMNTEDWQRCIKVIKKELDRREEVEVWE